MSVSPPAMSSSTYSELAPPAELGPYVKCFWHAAVRGTTVHEQLVLPDGSVDLIFAFRRAHPVELRAVGAMTRPLVSRMEPGDSMLGIRFRPGGAYPFFKLPLHELSDLILPVQELDGSIADLESPEADDTSAFLTAVQRKLVRRIRGGTGVEPRIAKAAALVEGAIKAGREPITVASLAQTLNMSRQHLRRLFDKHTGLGPVKFIRITRLQALLEHPVGAAGSGPLNWAEIALQFGYFDQAHLINDFREFTGRTPGFHFSNT